jgi:hypothetical protein
MADQNMEEINVLTDDNTRISHLLGSTSCEKILVYRFIDIDKNMPLRKE